MLHMFQVRLQESADTLDLFCDMCKVKCSGSANMRDHMASKKHKVVFSGRCALIHIIAVEGTEEQRGEEVGPICL